MNPTTLSFQDQQTAEQATNYLQRHIAGKVSQAGNRVLIEWQSEQELSNAMVSCLTVQIAANQFVEKYQRLEQIPAR